MNNTNICSFMKDFSTYVTNINRVLKNIKSDIMANFICIEKISLVITTNKVASTLNLQIIKKYVKNSYSIKVNNVNFLRLPQSKSYLKIISIPYIFEISNSHITLGEIKSIIKANYIFNNVILVSKPRVIKMSLKLDISII